MDGTVAVMTTAVQATWSREFEEDSALVLGYLERGA